ncbi:alpha-galactosidase [Novosphingobium sp.]|uniref:alpha-galactosidase n=1 Tax=Novosphingobium sp. TaxID=1874826 RepID=UPI00286E7802|nr:alpha-galactosidase [Novosphingobium sp.]
MTAELAFLHSDEASLVLECSADGAPLWRHLGARVDAGELAALAATRTGASFSLDADVPFSTLPPAGLGWFGQPALVARQNGAALVPVFGEISVEAEGMAIRITAKDAASGLEVIQQISLAPGGAFLFDSRVSNRGAAPVAIDWLASALLPLPASSAQLISWRGRHNAELTEYREPMPQHGWLREGRRGIPGHGGPPGVVVLDQGAVRFTGLVHSLQLAWSGDSRVAIERDDEGMWVLCAGAVPAAGEIVLQRGESWSAPQAILAISTGGTNGAMAQQHAAMRQRIGWPGGAMRPRPVHANSWEACYFDHDEERVIALAEACAAVGIERFVLDDGWFKGRNDDRAGLGDWTTDPVKYPHGLKPLADRIIGMGMEFGLWVEPEMINADSDLYRAHPDWTLALPGRDRPTARNQLVLDMHRGDVRDYLFGALDAVLRDLPVSYLKWDHNRDLAPAGGAAQVLGSYELFARLRAAHPSVEIESCAGGGGRSDAGILAFTHRFWASDNLDAVSRTAIQRGFLNFLPSEVMGSHIGASPAHATGRSQSLGFRAAIAMPGHFGIELDPRRLDSDETAQLADWIAFHKQWRGLLHEGRVWLGEGADGLVWQAQGSEREFLLFAIRTAPALDRRPQPLKLPFLAHAARCELELLRIASGRQQHASPLPELWQKGASFSGSWLAHAGLPMPPLGAETVAIFHAKVQA